MLIALLAFHILAAVFWVGGMAFAYSVLRPSAGPLEPAARFALWRRVLGRFLPLAGIAIVALLVSGYAMLAVYFGGPATAPLYINVMQGTGILMMMLFLHIVFAPWRRFRTAVDTGDLPQAGRRLNQIRMLIAANIVLGIITVLAGSTGRYW